MINDLPFEFRSHEIERNAYNAAFYELGLRWHWDSETYQELLLLSSKPEARICHYLQTRQPHLLKAYDAAFLAGVIEEAMTLHKVRAHASGDAGAGQFDWAQARGCELGA